MLHIYYISVTYMSLQVNTLLNRKNRLLTTMEKIKKKINLLTAENKKTGLHTVSPVLLYLLCLEFTVNIGNTYQLSINKFF